MFRYLWIAGIIAFAAIGAARQEGNQPGGGGGRKKGADDQIAETLATAEGKLRKEGLRSEERQLMAGQMDVADQCTSDALKRQFWHRLVDITRLDTDSATATLQAATSASLRLGVTHYILTQQAWANARLGRHTIAARLTASALRKRDGDQTMWTLNTATKDMDLSKATPVDVAALRDALIFQCGQISPEPSKDETVLLRYLQKVSEV